MNLVNKIFVKNTSHKKEVKSVVFSLFASILFVFAIKGYIETFRKNNPRPNKDEMARIAFDIACEDFQKIVTNFDCNSRIEFINGYTIPSTVTDDPPFVFWFIDKQQSKPGSAVGVEITLKKNGTLDSIADLPDSVKSDNIDDGGWTYKPIFLK